MYGEGSVECKQSAERRMNTLYCSANDVPDWVKMAPLASEFGTAFKRRFFFSKRTRPSIDRRIFFLPHSSPVDRTRDGSSLGVRLLIKQH